MESDICYLADNIIRNNKAIYTVYEMAIHRSLEQLAPPLEPCRAGSHLEFIIGLLHPALALGE
jgi:hypothetical protein